MPNFKHFSPIQRLNAGFRDPQAFGSEKKINMFGGRRYHRFIACGEAFRQNILAINWILRRIAEHYKLTYKKEDRLSAGKYQIIQNTILLSMDLESFFLKLKIVLDCVAFFVPFYYKDPLLHKSNGVQKDARDLNDPWAFRTMSNHFMSGKKRDVKFRKILQVNADWIEDVLWKRDILQHKFHRMSVSHDYWTTNCYAYLYEFNQKRDFIPDVLAYVSVIYFKLVRFLKETEEHFKGVCEREILGYKYFHEGSSYSSRLDKSHLFFVAKGRVLNDKILIRIHPNLRSGIEALSVKILNDLKMVCRKCRKVNFKIRPTIEHYILISAQCSCGNVLPLSNSVAKRFTPHYFDRNNDSDLWDLRPEYKLEEKVTY